MATFSVTVEEYDPGALGDRFGGWDWQLDPARAALLVHDLQPYYLGVLAPGVRSRLLAGVGRALEWADRAGVPVLASAPRPAADPAQRGLLGQRWGLGPTAEQARECALERLAAPDVVRISKRSYSAFFATDLETELRRTGRDQLLIAGVYASAGILATCLDAHAREVRPFVLLDATADYTAADHRRGLETAAALAAAVLPSVPGPAAH
ncbi:isochorismatase family protein [Streptomyces sp. NPDC059918]|uniref:isochorismatase family protein n=1 Tax=unclassified Streptomyces TaxID=2593676 RepID=UPI0036660BCA